MRKIILSLLGALSVSTAVADNIAYAPDKKITVVPFSNRIWYQKDGDTKWTLDQGIYGEAKFRSVIYGGGKFVAVANKGTIWYSVDGINWNMTNGINNNTQFNSVTYTGSKYVAVGWGSSSANSIFTSKDGANWSSEITVNNDFRDLRSVTSDNKGETSTVVAVGAGGTCAIKYGEENPRIYCKALDSTHPGWHLHDVTYGNGKFVAVGSKSQIWVSSDDGITWAKGKNNQGNQIAGSGEPSLNKVIYIPEKKLFVAVGDNSTTWSSENGTNWEKGNILEPGNLMQIQTITYGNGMCLIGGSTTNGDVTQSFTSFDCKNWDKRRMLWNAPDLSIYDYTPLVESLIYKNKIFQAIVITQGFGLTYKESCTTSDGDTFKCQNIE